MNKKFIYLLSTCSILSLTSCGNKPSFSFDVVGNSYVAKNSSYTYNATKEGVIYNNVTWSVDNTNLASIDENGVLTLKESEGTINVIATSKDDKNKKATHEVEIVGESIEKETFLSKLEAQESEFWSLFGDYYKKEISTTHRESDFVLYNGEPTVIKNIRYYVHTENSGRMKERYLNCNISDTEISRVDYPELSSIKQSFDDFEKYEKEESSFKGYRDYFMFTKDTRNYISYYLEYEYDNGGSKESKLVYRAFTSGFIINYLEINNEQPEIYLHLTPVEP